MECWGIEPGLHPTISTTQYTSHPCHHPLVIGFTHLCEIFLPFLEFLIRILIWALELFIGGCLIPGGLHDIACNCHSQGFYRPACRARLALDIRQLKSDFRRHKCDLCLLLHLYKT